MRIIERNAYCTGGGFYSFTGKIEDGNFFLAESEGSVIILDAPVDSDDCFYWEWLEPHMVREMGEQEAEDFILQILTEILENGCTGNDSNYNDADIRNYKEIYEEIINER